MQQYRQCVLKEETHLFRFPTTSTFSSFFISTRVVLLKYFHPSRFFVMRPMRTHKRPECNFYWCRVESVCVCLWFTKCFIYPHFPCWPCLCIKKASPYPLFVPYFYSLHEIEWYLQIFCVLLSKFVFFCSSRHVMRKELEVIIFLWWKYYALLLASPCKRLMWCDKYIIDDYLNMMT